MKLSVCISAVFLFFLIIPFKIDGQDLSVPDLSNYQLLNVDTRQMYYDVKGVDDAVVVEFVLLGHALNVYQNQTVSDNYSVVHDGVAVNDYNRPIAMQGHTNQGYPVRLTVGPDFLMVSMVTPEGKRWLEPAKGIVETSGQFKYVTYLETDVISDPNARCGVHKTQNLADQQVSRQTAAMGTCYTVEYAICHDYSMTTQLGTAIDVENFGVAITNELNDLYDNQFADVLEFSITGQYISTSTSNDPWTTSTDVVVLLQDFATWSQANLAFTHDDATLWTRRNLANSGNGTVIGYAYIGGICTSSKYNICEHQNISGVNKVLVSHEVGHNFNLQHVVGVWVMNMFSAPSFTTWSPTSVTNIALYYNSLPSGCLDSPCGAITPTVEWSVANSSVEEISIKTDTVGACFERYFDHTLVIERSNSSPDNIVVNASVNPSSTANNSDYDLINSSVTFTSGGPNVETITLRVYDDAIEEASESIILDLSIGSGNAILGNSIHTLTINDSRDVVSMTCCSEDGPIDWDPGAPYFNLATFFRGSQPAFRSRYLLTASQLASAGLLTGPISELQLNVNQKNSTAPYQGMTIKLANYVGTVLPSSWISTTEVFSQSYTTVEGWNPFPFSTPFVWDGSSALYVELCFANSMPGGDDLLLTKSIISNNNGGHAEASGSATICTDPVMSSTVHTLIPLTRFFTRKGAKIETNTTTLISSAISVDETAHVYSDSSEVIASLTNTGSADLECVDVHIESSGLGSTLFNGSVQSYHDKTIAINPSQTGAFQLSLYYTDAELAVWGGQINDLYVVQSQVPFSSATIQDIQVFPTERNAFTGSDSGTTFQATVIGSGFFGITDQLPQDPVEMSGHLHIVDVGAGLLLSSPDGSRYLVTAMSNGSLQVASASPAIANQAELINADLKLNGASSLYLMSSSGVAQYSMNNDGELVYMSAVAPSPPVSRLFGGHFEVMTVGRSLVMTAPDGSCYSISISDAGELSISPAVCP